MIQNCWSAFAVLMLWIVYSSAPIAASMDELDNQASAADADAEGTSNLAERQQSEEWAKRLLHELAQTRDQSELRGRTIEILTELAEIRYAQGRITEADEYFDEALAAQALSQDELQVAALALQFGRYYVNCSRYARAAPLLCRALTIRERELDAADLRIAECYAALALLQSRQGRFEEAVVTIGHVMNIQDAANLAQSDPQRAAAMLDLAEAHLGLKDYDSASAIYQTASGMLRKAYGKHHIKVIECLSALGDVCSLRGEPRGAKHFYRQTLGTLEKHYGVDHPMLCPKLIYLARSQFELKEESANILANLDRAESILTLHKLAPYEAFPLYLLRAKVHRTAGNDQAALNDLRCAMDLAELLRSGSSGDAIQRASYFTTFYPAFETAVAWQLRDGDVALALEAIERSHARSLLDQFRLAAFDLAADEPPGVRELHEEIGLLYRALQNSEAEYEQLAREWQSNAEDHQRLNELVEEIESLHKSIYRLYRDLRVLSPAYRDAVEHRSKVPTLRNVRERMLDEKTLLLTYLVGSEGGYVTLVTRRDAQLIALNLSEADASRLEVEPGGLTSERLEAILLGPNGLLAQLARAEPQANSNVKLRVLAGGQRGQDIAAAEEVPVK